MRVTYVNDDGQELGLEIATEHDQWVDRQEIHRYLESLLKDLGEGWGYFRNDTGSIAKDKEGSTL